MSKSLLYIGGKYVDSLEGLTFKNFSPANGSKICDVSEAGALDVESAVKSGQIAHRVWKGMDPSSRGAVLIRIADEIDKHGAELAALDSEDAGRPILDCMEDIHAASAMFRYFGGLADKISGHTLPVQNDKLCYTKREPYGIVAAITAWNYPLFNAAAKIAPILAMGNSCILKPAEEAPRTALRLAEIIHAVDTVPDGLVNVINGLGETTGALLANHCGVGKISFTGSTETGRKILHAAADSNLKGAVLELGGKGPFLIFADAKLDMALNAVTFSVFYNQGQTCTAGTRLIVDKSIRDLVVKGLEERLGRVKIGLPQSEGTSVGPLASKEQFEKVTHYLNLATKEGVEPIIKISVPEGLDKGYFVGPVVFENLPADSPMRFDEIFGPILVLDTFSSEEDALTMANDTKFGLSASIWTESLTRMISLSDEIQAGIVWCNTAFAEHPGAPAGGYGHSGFGREYGTAAIEEYTKLKTVWIDKSGEFFAWP